MNYNLSAEDLNALNEIKLRVEDNSKQIDEIIEHIIHPYIKDLDRYVSFVRDCLKDGEKPPTVSELEDFCMNLSTLIYFASGMCENLGVRDDIAKAVYKEQYHASRSSLEKGTVADKDSLAELNSRQEQIVSICFTRAYKTLKSKIDAAQELLASAKKVLSNRITEMELTKLSNNTQSQF